MSTLPKLGRKTGIAVIILIAVIGLAALSFHTYAEQCRSYAYHRSIVRHIENSRLAVDSLRIEFRRAREYALSAAVSFAHCGELDSEDAREHLEGIQPHSGFENLWLITPDGLAHDKHGAVHDVSDTAYFAKAMSSGPDEAGVASVTRANAVAGKIFYVFSPVYSDGEIRGAVLGAYELHSIAFRSDGINFGGMGYMHILDGQGNLILRSGSENTLIGQENAVDFFKNASYANEYSSDMVITDILNGKPGATVYKTENGERLAYYAPLDVNGWTAFSAAPMKVVESFATSMHSYANTLIFKLMGCFAVLVGGIVFFFQKSRRAILAANRQLNFSNQRFRIAVFHASNGIIQYDVAHDSLLRLADSRDGRNADVEVADIATDLLPDCFIDKDFLPALREALKGLRNGNRCESCVVKAWTPENKRKWYKLSFNNIFEDDIPIQAIGTVEDVTVQKESEINYAMKERHRLAMMAGVLETFVFNVSKERYLYGYKPHENADGRPDTIYAGKMDIFINDTVHPDHRDEVYKAMSTESLMRNFENGTARVIMEFRAVNGPDGDERWLRSVTNLAVDPETTDVMGYSYIEDITEAKLDEIALRQEAERDGLTGLYNRQATNRLIKEHVTGTHGRREASPDAFFIVDLDKFKYVNDTYGHAAGDEVLAQLGRILTDVFRSTDVVGRMGGDEFVIYAKNAGPRENIRGKATRVCDALKGIVLSADPEYRISGSVGVCMVPPSEVKIEELYAQADAALYEAKRRGRDCFKVYSPSMHGGSTTVTHVEDKVEEKELVKVGARETGLI